MTPNMLQNRGVDKLIFFLSGEILIVLMFLLIFFPAVVREIFNFFIFFPSDAREDSYSASLLSSWMVVYLIYLIYIS